MIYFICKKENNGRFTQTGFHFLRTTLQNACVATILGKTVSHEDGDGMQVPFNLRFSVKEKFIDLLEIGTLGLRADSFLKSGIPLIRPPTGQRNLAVLMM